MKRKRKIPALDLNPHPFPPLPPIITPDASGNAIGDPTTDTGGIAMAQQGKTAQISHYGVAYAPNGGSAHAGAQGAAVVHGGVLADSGDGAISYIWDGTATVGQLSAAFALRGDAKVYRDGVATVLMDGSAKIDGEGGVACALNYKIQNTEMVTDPTAGKVSGGKGSVVVAFTVDKKGNRVPIVGYIGDQPGWLDDVLNLETKLLDFGVQFGLKANVDYRLNAKTSRFEEVKVPKAKKANKRTQKSKSRSD